MIWAVVVGGVVWHVVVFMGGWSFGARWKLAQFRSLFALLEKRYRAPMSSADFVEAAGAIAVLRWLRRIAG